MPYIKKADNEATNRLIQYMAENEQKARTKTVWWQVVAFIEAGFCLLLYFGVLG